MRGVSEQREFTGHSCLGRKNTQDRQNIRIKNFQMVRSSHVSLIVSYIYFVFNNIRFSN